MSGFTNCLRFAFAAWMAIACPAAAADWQWWTPAGDGATFLWIPPECRHVRAIVLAQNNMIEPGILEHSYFRAALARLCIGEVFVAPPFATWQEADSNDAANRALDGILRALGERSGYRELSRVPIAPMGHSAMASFPWNFAAWNPARTLAILSVKGDAPQTAMTGNGKPNAVWGTRTIDGIPGLMVMAEYEWLEGRLEPLLAFRDAHPRTPLALLAEPGRGHFDYSDQLVDFLALFLRKAAAYRLPRRGGALRFVDPSAGWLVERWRMERSRRFSAAPAAAYQGGRRDALWAFDAETARAIEAFGADQEDKAPQLLAFSDHGAIVPQTETHQQVTLPFQPQEDGVTFSLSAAYLDTVEPVAKNLSRWTRLPPGSHIGNAGGPIALSRISGPVVQVSADTFRVQFDRIAATSDRRTRDIWLLASQPGNARYKSAVQQALIRLPEFTEGAPQRIDFPVLADQQVGTAVVPLRAFADSGRPVFYYVLAGPAEVEGDHLRLTPVPRRARMPVAVTVVAWVLGRGTEPKLQTAEPVVRTFYLHRRARRTAVAPNPLYQ